MKTGVTPEPVRRRLAILLIGCTLWPAIVAAADVLHSMIQMIGTPDSGWLHFVYVSTAIKLSPSYFGTSWYPLQDAIDVNRPVILFVLGLAVLSDRHSWWRMLAWAFAIVSAGSVLLEWLAGPLMQIVFVVTPDWQNLTGKISLLLEILMGEAVYLLQALLVMIAVVLVDRARKQESSPPIYFSPPPPPPGATRASDSPALAAPPMAVLEYQDTVRAADSLPSILFAVVFVVGVLNVARIVAEGMVTLINFNLLGQGGEIMGELLPLGLFDGPFWLRFDALCECFYRIAWLAVLVACWRSRKSLPAARGWVRVALIAFVAWGLAETLAVYHTPDTDFLVGGQQAYSAATCLAIASMQLIMPLLILSAWT